MKTETFVLKPGPIVPNNKILPVIVYRQAVTDDADKATAFEKEFSKSGWQGSWRNGVYDYHHYHTRAHEVLGIARGSARLMLGGPDGMEIDLQAGDCLVLPAGTGHCRLSASKDFLVVGAYPPDQHVDIKTEAPSEADLQAIRACPLPARGPVSDGALPDLWGS